MTPPVSVNMAEELARAELVLQEAQAGLNQLQNLMARQVQAVHRAEGALLWLRKKDEDSRMPPVIPPVVPPVSTATPDAVSEEDAGTDG